MITLSGLSEKTESEAKMTIKINILDDTQLDETDYGISVLQAGILPVYFSKGQRVEAIPSRATLYPVIIDVNNDDTIYCFEVFMGATSIQIENKLISPSQKTLKRVQLEQVNEKRYYPILRLNPTEKLILFDTQQLDNIKEAKHIQIADKIIVSVSTSNEIVGIWLLDIPDEAIEYCMTSTSKNSNSVRPAGSTPSTSSGQIRGT